MDLLSVLDRRVTRGRAPRTLTASKRDAGSGAPLPSRPLCQYPASPLYKGRGKVKLASRLACTAA